MQSQITNGKLSGWAPVFTRLALGTIFVVYGAGKLFGIGPKGTGIPGFAGFLASLGVPMPELFAWIVGLVELVGGILLLAGLFTRYVSVLLAIDMLTAIVLFHLPNGFDVATGGFEFAMTLMLVSIALVFSGPGRLSLERAIFDRELLPKTRSDETIDQPIEA